MPLNHVLYIIYFTIVTVHHINFTSTNHTGMPLLTNIAWKRIHKMVIGQNVETRGGYSLHSNLDKAAILLQQVF